MLRLHIDAHWASPYALFAYAALMEKGLPFETRLVALQRQEQRTDAFVARSLTGKIPLLEDGAFALSESTAIVEYLEDKYPAPAFAPVLPRQLEQRARARQLLAWLNSDFAALREERSTHSVFYKPVDVPLGAKARAEADKLVRVAETLIAEGQTMMFDNWSVADVALAMMLMRLKASGEPLPMKLVRFVDTQWARPSVAPFVTRERPPFEPY